MRPQIGILVSVTLLLVSGCVKRLPRCDEEGVKDGLSDIFRNQIRLAPLLKRNGYILKEVSGFSEKKRVSTKERRVCSLSIVTDRSTEPILYDVTWIARSKGEFRVSVAGYDGLPTCDSWWLHYHIHGLVTAGALTEKYGTGGFVELALINSIRRTASLVECRFELLGKRKTIPLHVQVVPGKGTVWPRVSVSPVQKIPPKLKETK